MRRQFFYQPMFVDPPNLSQVGPWWKLDVCLASLIFANLFLLLFMNLIALFCTIRRSHNTISTNIYLYLQYFQQKVFSFNKINGFQTDFRLHFLQDLGLCIAFLHCSRMVLWLQIIPQLFATDVVDCATFWLWQRSCVIVYDIRFFPPILVYGRHQEILFMVTHYYLHSFYSFKVYRFY